MHFQPYRSCAKLEGNSSKGYCDTHFYSCLVFHLHKSKANISMNSARKCKVAQHSWLGYALFYTVSNLLWPLSHWTIALECLVEKHVIYNDSFLREYTSTQCLQSNLLEDIVSDRSYWSRLRGRRCTLLESSSFHGIKIHVQFT